MRTHLWKFLLILLLALLCANAVYPPRDKLRLGKDLAGGVTILYGIKPDETTGRQPSMTEIMQMVTVIRDRIDPRGIYDISIEALGTNQIEISMPLPTPEVKAARQALDAHLDSLVASAIDPYELDEVFRLSPSERAERIAAYSAAVPARAEPFQRAVQSFDRLQRLEEQYRPLQREAEAAVNAARDAEDAALRTMNEALNAAEQAGVDGIRLASLNIDAPQDEINQTIDDLIAKMLEAKPEADAAAAREAAEHYLALRRAHLDARENLTRTDVLWRVRLEPTERAAEQADRAFEEALEEIRRTSIDIEDVRRILALETRPRRQRDAATGREIAGPSVRDEALARLKSSFPVLKEQIDRAVVLFDSYRSRSRGYDDPKDLIALLRGAGVLSFRITVRPSDPFPFDDLRRTLRERGPAGAGADESVRWYAIDNPEAWADNEQMLAFLNADPVGFFSARGYVVEEFDGTVYMLLHRSRERALDETSGDWRLTGASRTQDPRSGRPAVSFRLDVSGARLFAQLTGNNIERAMAIVLDDRIYSAPTIQSRISDQGQITGNFSDKDIEYLLKVLNSGSLQARLTEAPIAQNTVGPKLGLDNLKRGLEAGILSFIVVAIFMVFYYFRCGAVADVALAFNGLFILGAMAFNQAVFTMPGIAGVVLTFGMAVDSNVLIYERIREELTGGADIKTAIRLGYEKAMSSIVDGNVTNLIVCFVLGFTATADVKGFAITLGIGVVSTLFSALFITRAIFEAGLATGTIHRLSMLPMVWKALGQALHPNINWVAMRKFWYGFSALAVVAGLSLTWATWKEMLDTEFLGGTTVTFSLRADDSGQPIKLPRAEVERRIREYAARGLAEGDISEAQYRGLFAANVFNLNADEVEGEGFAGSAFVIKTTVYEQDVVERAIVKSFDELLDIPRIIRFDGSDLSAQEGPPVFPVIADSLGENINRPAVRTNVRPYLGSGVAVVLNNLDPPMPTEEIRKRLDVKRRSPEFESLLGRTSTIVGITRAADGPSQGPPTYSEVAIVVKGDVAGVSYYDDPDRWKALVADREWNLIRSALTEPPTLDQITTISPTVAEQFRATALVSIGLSLMGILAYIWVRFGSFRYSAAAVVALVHDVCVTLGLLSLTHYVYNSLFGRVLLIEPFKIDMGVIAALLTIIGYSLNDTIIVMDRIRENRGKLALATADVVNRSINSTISRTVLTSGTTLMALTIMYFEGGTGIRPFAFAMLCGIVVGTYSSIGVAAPMVLTHRRPKNDRKGIAVR